MVDKNNIDIRNVKTDTHLKGESSVPLGSMYVAYVTGSWLDPLHTLRQLYTAHTETS